MAHFLERVQKRDPRIHFQSRNESFGNSGSNVLEKRPTLPADSYSSEVFNPHRLLSTIVEIGKRWDDIHLPFTYGDVTIYPTEEQKTVGSFVRQGYTSEYDLLFSNQRMRIVPIAMTADEFLTRKSSESPKVLSFPNISYLVGHTYRYDSQIVTLHGFIKGNDDAVSALVVDQRMRVFPVPLDSLSIRSPETLTDGHKRISIIGKLLPIEGKNVPVRGFIPTVDDHGQVQATALVGIHTLRAVPLTQLLS